MSKLLLAPLALSVVVASLYVGCDSAGPSVEDIRVPIMQWCVDQHKGYQYCYHRKIVDIGKPYTVRDPIGGVTEVTLWPVKVAFYDYTGRKNFGQDTCPDDPDCKWLETVTVVVYQDSFGEWKATSW